VSLDQILCNDSRWSIVLQPGFSSKRLFEGEKRGILAFSFLKFKNILQRNKLSDTLRTQHFNKESIKFSLEFEIMIHLIID